MALNIGRAIRGAGKLSGRAASATAKTLALEKPAWAYFLVEQQLLVLLADQRG